MSTISNSLNKAFTLGFASTIDYSLQFITPMVLVRVLSVIDFGHYRAFWLVANTAYAIATIGMPFSLFYFIPRKTSKEINLISNTILFLILSGSISAILFVLINPILPTNIHSLPLAVWMTALFIALWIIGSLLDVLPNAENRINDQAKWIVIMAVTRFLVVSVVAYVTNSFVFIGLSLIAFGLLKCLSLILTIVWKYREFPIKPQWNLCSEQLKYAVPFGVAGLFYNLREHGDQWIAAIKFSIENFACFSLAGVAAPVAGIVRQSVSNAVLPKMNENLKIGNIENTLKLNRAANWLTAALLVPILCYGYFFAEDLVVLVYTEKYRNAYQPLQVYLIGLFSQIFVANNLMISMAKGKIMLIINLICFPISLIISLIGASWIGISGAALGSAFTLWAGNLAGLFYTKKDLNVKINDLTDIKKIILYIVIVSIVMIVIKNILDQQLEFGTFKKVFFGSFPAILIASISIIRLLKDHEKI